MALPTNNIVLLVLSLIQAVNAVIILQQVISSHEAMKSFSFNSSNRWS
ncbi:hypothetical protein GDO81_006245 [Engystomops pustulosus]|uniref:Uncharacterized protein n=1 Tax=Engystomops pustulosus TaxID=76066 RepID=A0AAV7CVC7_ENGPU|nr:hypothetical protein GDO81_006245 [Engystomops pustulosus]